MSKTIVAFDLNKTLIRENSWYELNLAMGISAQEDEILYRLGPEGEGVLSYEEWVNILVRVIRKRGRANRDRVEKSILDYAYIDGAYETIAALKAKGFLTGIISGALEPIAKKAQSDLGLDFSFSNASLEFDESGMLKDINLQNSDFAFKAETVLEMKRNNPEAGIYYVADGDNDEEVFKACRGIMINPQNVVHEAWKQEAVASKTLTPHKNSAKNAWKVVSNLYDVPRLFE